MASSRINLRKIWMIWTRMKKIRQRKNSVEYTTFTFSPLFILWWKYHFMRVNQHTLMDLLNGNGSGADAASVDFHNPDFVKFAVFEQGFRYIHKSTTWIPASIAQYFLPSCKHLNASSSVTASLLWIMSLFFPKSSHVKSPVKCDRHLVMRGTRCASIYYYGFDRSIDV